MNTKSMKMDVGGKQGGIKLLQKKFQTLWSGEILAEVSYWDKPLTVSSIPLSANAKWQVSSEVKGSRHILVYSHSLLEFSITVILLLSDNKLTVSIPADKIKEGQKYKIKSIRLLPYFGASREGDTGYLVLPQQSGILCNCKGKMSAEYKIGVYGKGPSECSMPVFGIKKKNTAMFAIITGGQFDATLIMSTNWGQRGLYSIYPEFTLRYFSGVKWHPEYIWDIKITEDICVEYHFLDSNEANYVGMGKVYRNYNLNQRRLKPLRERIEEFPCLDYSSEALEVRIRLGVKPVPNKIIEQTPENEPEMQVFCTFKKAGEIMDEFHKQGIKKVEFCLVGWNSKGHDGRYPQIFPVEEKLGGEEELKKAIRKGQDLGYQVAAHDCYFDAYKISDDWDEEYLRKDFSGGLQKGSIWGGGQSYDICLQKAYELFVKRDFPKIRKLGFKGLHYSDCLSSVGPLTCNDPKHPLTKREDVEYRNKILNMAREIFGGSQSESLLDFAVPAVDRILGTGISENKDYIDTVIPLFQIVYHGFILYSFSWNTLPGEKSYLQGIEYGALPLIYFYKNFITDTKKGEFSSGRDFVYRNKRDLIKEICKIKSVYEDVQELAYLQKEFIENHRMLKRNVYETGYSDGSRVIVNYSNAKYTDDNGVAVEPCSYRLYEPKKEERKQSTLQKQIKDEERNQHEET